ncbi:MAG TPA: M20/M25/M40 family metallo-hydrolase [Anaerolineales bacterium]|nr:M20/M25/M40 family metallo-hydrolase [Anaerolineales bacterium]HNB85085.1 M20/M25/M40 family metallo-hydrolase [Anaerolineales bacterium]HNC89816.1 M20/M25/M40 family metallo-hydrolase [Anaerolineales bacterium]HNF35628.1 M20/M25/M40 family metallo-hydrolase [Anaerolineales bacterium]
MPQQFADKYLLAVEQAIKEKPQGGLDGFEQEWNLLDEELRPLLTVGAGPSQHSFVDYLRAECVPHWHQQFSQLEVFHWMVEWATRPYYTPRGAMYEARLMEATLMNALHRAGVNFGERLHYWHGNLLFLTDIGHQSIPGNWSLAKRRYLEKCVDLYGDTLATTGIHTNMSLPDPLFAWDFMHLSPSERGDQHLDEFKSEFYITATRLLRAFASLFIATSASTPMQAQVKDGRAAVILTEFDSIRNLTFPNPREIDLPDLYRSYNDYLQISYDLVRRGVRFGNNNWTPVRARSFSEPVERIISTTSDQLSSLYARGLFAAGQSTPPEEMARQVERQNLMARINLPMGRVEVRVDEGGHSLDLDIANMTFRHLLLLKIYSDPQFARGFRYDREDITRARANENMAAKHGLRAEIENPLTGKPITVREFLKWTLNELKPLAQGLNMWDDLHPLVEMSEGGRNTSEKIRARLKMEIGDDNEVPLPLLKEFFYEHEAQVKADVETICANHASLGADSAKIAEFIQRSRDTVRSSEIPNAPVQFRPRAQAVIEISYPNKTAEILDLAQQLIRIPSVTACPVERFEEVHRAGSLIDDYLRNAGLDVKYFDGKYPAIYATFPGASKPNPILLTGHFDVVEPEPDDSQFNPRIEGDYLFGRGAADMKTVVATYLVWMKDMCKSASRPNIALMLVGNEENGEAEAWGTPHVLKELNLTPSLFIAGERTGEKGNELFGEICVENRGVMRFDVIARGAKGHSGVAGTGDLSEKLIAARSALNEIFASHLTLKAADGWQSQAKFPFITVGTPGVYNVTAAEGILGVEIRPIPQDDVTGLRLKVESYCAENGLEASFNVMENGVACDPNNPALKALIEAVRQASGGEEPRIGKKLPGTSARFAPGGQAVVWGQSGVGPHAKNEAHYIPSIEPYYNSLNELAKLWK